jgi:hypothetical protein
MKIVQFKNGNYGIRKLTGHGYEYLEVKNNTISHNFWSKDYRATYCESDSLEFVKKRLQDMTDIGKVVK